MALEPRDPQEDRVRSRPTSRLTSYLHSHQISGSTDASSPSSAEFNWPIRKTDHTGGLYSPDMETICNSIRLRLMNYPYSDLPARYNGCILRVLEELHSSLAENARLRSRLEHGDKSHSVTRGESGAPEPARIANFKRPSSGEPLGLAKRDGSTAVNLLPRQGDNTFQRPLSIPEAEASKRHHRNFSFQAGDDLALQTHRIAQAGEPAARRSNDRFSPPAKNHTKGRMDGGELPRPASERKASTTYPDENMPNQHAPLAARERSGPVSTAALSSDGPGTRSATAIAAAAARIADSRTQARH
jgi:hypothetical protein